MDPEQTVSLKKSLVLLLSLASIPIAGCGGSEEGWISLEVRNSRAPAGLAALSVGPTSSNKLIGVTRFKVTVTGVGIPAPIEVSADGSAAGMQIDGIPSGEGRSVLIEALNQEGTVIRRRKIDGIEVVPEVVTPVRTSLNTIPLIMNLRPGSVVLSRNLKLIGFGEPGTSIRIDAATSSESVPLNRSAGPASLVVSPAASTGLFEFTPPANTLLGKQTITLTDEASGESSSIGIYVVRGGNRPGHRINTAAAYRPIATVGTGLGGRSVHYPRLLRALTEQPKKEKL